MKARIRILFLTVMTLSAALLTSCSQVTTFQGTTGPVSLQSNPRHIALLLPLSGQYAGAGQAVRDGFLTAYYNTTPSATSPTVVRVYDTASGKSLTTLYQQAMADKADIIVGPLQKDDVAQFAKLSPAVPVIALNYPTQAVRVPSGFYEYGLSPQDEATQVARKAWNDGHRNIIVVYPSDVWGTGIVNSFTQQWQQFGGKIVDSLGYQQGQDFQAAMKQLFQAQTCGKQQANCSPTHRQDVDSVFLVANSQTARQIIPMMQFNYAGDLPIYSTSLIYDGIPNPNYYRDMGNVIFADMPWVLSNSPQLQQAQKQISSNWPNPYQNYLRLYGLGLDAFALTTQLNNLASNPGTTYNGVTGVLSVNNQQQISRQLNFAQFQNGQVVPK